MPGHKEKPQDTCHLPFTDLGPSVTFPSTEGYYHFDKETGTFTPDLPPRCNRSQECFSSYPTCCQPCCRCPSPKDRPCRCPTPLIDDIEVYEPAKSNEVVVSVIHPVIIRKKKKCCKPPCCCPPPCVPPMPLPIGPFPFAGDLPNNPMAGHLGHGPNPLLGNIIPFVSVFGAE